MTSTLLEPRPQPIDDFARSGHRSQSTIRVLHVINGEHYAGAERVQDVLAGRLPELSVEVTIACVKPRQFPLARHSQETPLIELPMRGRFDLRPAWRLAKLVRREKFDLIHTHTPRTALVGQIAARLAGVPLVHHVHGQTAREVGAKWRTWVAAKTEDASLRGASAVIAVSPSAASYIAASGIPRERIHIVPNGVPGRAHFANRPTPQVGWTLGAIALFRPRKGLEVLLESLAILRRRSLPVRLRVVGPFQSPEYRQQATQLADRLGVADIDWRGFRSDIDAELDALDLLVLPSILAEGMPMTVLEALAAGVPPIGSRVAGIADVIEHGRNGLLVEPGNAAALADAIAAVTNGTLDWQRLRRNAVASHAANYSDHAMAQRVAQVYQQVLKR